MNSWNCAHPQVGMKKWHFSVFIFNYAWTSWYTVADIPSYLDHSSNNTTSQRTISHVNEDALMATQSSEYYTFGIIHFCKPGIMLNLCFFFYISISCCDDAVIVFWFHLGTKRDLVKVRKTCVLVPGVVATNMAGIFPHASLKISDLVATNTATKYPNGRLNHQCQQFILATRLFYEPDVTVEITKYIYWSTALTILQCM